MYFLQGVGIEDHRAFASRQRQSAWACLLSLYGCVYGVCVCVCLTLCFDVASRKSTSTSVVLLPHFLLLLSSSTRTRSHTHRTAPLYCIVLDLHPMYCTLAHYSSLIPTWITHQSRFHICPLFLRMNLWLCPHCAAHLTFSLSLIDFDYRLQALI